MKIVLSLRAQAEFGDAVEYLSKQSPAAAASFHDAVFESFELLRAFPHAGAPTVRPQLRRLILSYFPYIIYYRATGTAIEIVSIFAGARDPKTTPNE